MAVIGLGDCLEVLPTLEAGSVDLLYADPPFASGRNYVGTKGAFTDTWVSLDAYLDYMRERLEAMRRVLSPTGSIYLHCDQSASHRLRCLLDDVFGADRFRSEIVWRIGWVSGYKTTKKGWVRNHDTIFHYTKTDTSTFNKVLLPYPPNYRRRDGAKPTGRGLPLEDTWNCSAVDVLDSILIKSFSQEKVGYPTQKPLALLERIISASSNPGDLVFDPFMGSGTTLVAAKRLRRRYAGCDVSPDAVAATRDRLEAEPDTLFDGGDC